MARKYDVLNANDHIEYRKTFEAINDVIGSDYSGWMRATWPNSEGNGKFRIWFPKLALKKNGILSSASNDCLNTISNDWNEFVFDDFRDVSIETAPKFYEGYGLIFAKEPNGNYIFRGVYIKDSERSTPNHNVSKRIGTKVKLIGNPVYDIEILDGNKDLGINVALKPLKIENIDANTVMYTCPRCSDIFKKALRCPGCGQKIKEEQ